METTETTSQSAEHLHAAAVDTEIAEAFGAWMKAKQLEAAKTDTARRAAGQRSPRSRGDRWTHRVDGAWDWATLADAEATLVGKADERIHSYSKTAAEILLELSDARQATLDAGHAYLKAERAYEGWSRFFLVPGGHIHSSMDCSTCNHRGQATSFGWLPQLSGLSEAEAVAAHGPVLCTVCYPSAPTEWTAGQLNANGEYVAPKATCPGSNTIDTVGTPGPPRGYGNKRYAECRHCHQVVTYGNTGLRKHAPAKDTE